MTRADPNYEAYVRLIDQSKEKLASLSKSLHLNLNEFDILLKKYNNFHAVYRMFDAIREAKIESSTQTTSNNYEILQAQQSFQKNIGHRLEQHLVNLKTSEAFAKGIEHDNIKGKKFEDWFTYFDNSLKKLFENTEAKLFFSNENRKFTITDGSKFASFQNLSSGYKAIFDIYADLLLRTEFFEITPTELEGIVLIDEIDAHLHISLQKLILPFFTESFPNIQFIVSTHSPFVITSTNNDTVVYDISSGEFFEEDLSLYSHESIIKELFHVKNNNEKIEELSAQLLNFIESNESTESLSAIQDLLDEINKDFEKLSVELQLQYMVAKNKLAKLQHEGN